MNTRTSRPLAVGLAAAIVLGSGIATGTSGSASAAPLAANQLAVKDAATDNVINVHRRGHGNGAAFAALAIGVIGAVIAHEAYRKQRRRHRDYYYSGYDPYYYPQPYAYSYSIRRGGGHHRYHHLHSRR